jgi:hypothetical protein
MIVGDTKTGRELEYASGSYATQLTAYVDSMRYDVVTDTREPFSPESVKDWALIIHADSGGERIDVYWVDLAAGRIGLALADNVRQWRRRDDLLIIGRQLRIAPAIEPELPPEPEPEPPALAPREPVEGRRLASRHEYLAERIRAILAHSAVAGQALARAWPEGVSGLRNDGQSWEQLDDIQSAVELIEASHSVPFYPPWDDPELADSMADHPSNVWAEPKLRAATQEDRETVRDQIEKHPRAALMRKWIGFAIGGGIDHAVDTTALAHALFEFACLDETEWPDEDLTIMLDGSLRAIGYLDGVAQLGRFNPEHAPLLMSAAFAITAGNAYLLFDEHDKPIVRTNVREPNARGQ